MLSALFFLSGATGLVYESIWGRQLHLVFGTSQFAIATVLAAFMTGLALGGAIGGRLAPKTTRPLRVYAALEATVGLYALAFPTLLAALEPLYRTFAEQVEPGPVAFGIAQFVMVGVLLLVPTTCMGATLPLLVRLPQEVDAGEATGRLYGINTFGAVLGTWAAGFWLLPDHGVWATTCTAATGNLLLAAGALALDRQATPLAATAAGAEGTVAPRWLLVAALAGFSSLTLEVAWFRVLSLILGASTYAFSVMLLAFLVGIATGGRWGGPVADRLAARGQLVTGVAAVQVAVGGLSWLAMWGYHRLPLTFVQMWFVIEPMADTLIWPMKCVLAMLVMVPPALGMGAMFPLLVRAARDADLGATVGRIYAANTLGSIVGAFLAGFVLLPTLKVTGTVLLACGVNLVAASTVRPRWVPATLVAAALGFWLRAPWDPMWMTTGVYKYVDNLHEPTAAEIRKQMIDRYELLFYEEGLSSVVTVARNRVTGNTWLANNGKIDASTTTDMPTQVLVSHLPFLFTGGEARNVAVIGLASGISLGAVTLHRELTRIDDVEIEPALKKAARYFDLWNHGALLDPRVRVLENDGRNQLVLTPPHTYDVIVSEPSNPWLTGVSNLFTREFFEMGKERLAPGGIWSQWVQMYGMDDRDLRSVIRTFAEVYPHMLIFSTIQDADLVMVGSDRPLVPDYALCEELIRRSDGIEGEMAQIGVLDGYDLLSTFLMDRDTALFMTEGTPLNTDDNLLIEFSAPLNLHKQTSTQNFMMLLPNAATALQGVPDVDGLVRLAQAYANRSDWVRALVCLREAERLEPGRVDVQGYWNIYQRELRHSLGEQ